MNRSRADSLNLQRGLLFQTLQDRFSVLDTLARDLTASVGHTLNFLELAAGHESRKILPRLVVATELANRSVTALKRLLWELSDLRSETEHARRRDPALERRKGIERRRNGLTP